VGVARLIILIKLYNRILWSSRPRYWYYQYCNIYNTGITSILIFTILVFMLDAVVCTPLVRMDDATGSNHVLDDRQKSSCISSVDHS